MPHRFQLLEKIAFSLVCWSAAACSAFIAYERCPQIKVVLHVGEEVLRAVFVRLRHTGCGRLRAIAGELIRRHGTPRIPGAAFVRLIGVSIRCRSSTDQASRPNTTRAKNPASTVSAISADTFCGSTV
jgi:hypothetical protein